ncbi:hypothetical protein [Ilumatobacter sp.]|uniref:hypothetical protein n=1 Tax=Ilumatobacter sp. TaxID=1967498 RepID=UPI003AF81FC3
MERRGGPKVTIQGVTYRSLDEVPAKYRAFAAHFFEDADGDGVPDFIEQAAESSGLTTQPDQMFIVNGTAYTSIDEVPEKHRTAFERMTETPPTQPVLSERPSAGAQPASIVTTAGPSRRARMLVVAVIAVAVLGGVIWLLAR